MKTRFTKTIGLFLFICSLSLNAVSQNNTVLVSDLNIVLKSSSYKTAITIDDKGFVKREDNNGNSFEFNLNDIKSVEYVNDGFNNVIIKLKEGKKAKGVVEKKNTEASMNVISFKEKTDCEKAIEILKKMIKKN